MNKLDRESRAKVLQLLCEGMAVRAISRVTGVAKGTILKLLVDAGRACAGYQDRVLRGLPCQRVQVDEIFSFIYARSQNLPKAKAAPADAGEIWTWTAICADTKLLITFFVGDRTAASALPFIDDLKERLSSRVQLTSDGHKSYLQAVDRVFGDDIDYAMLVKIYGHEDGAKGQEGRYLPGECIGTKIARVKGNPDPAHINTAFAERHNLSMRMHMRRFTRLTNAHSKKIENHAYAIALHTMFYNFTKIHGTLKVTPAMAAGVTKRLWEMTDIVDVIDAWETRQVRQTRLAA